MDDSFALQLDFAFLSGPLATPALQYQGFSLLYGEPEGRAHR